MPDDPGDPASGCAGDACGVPLWMDASTVRGADPLEDSASSELVPGLAADDAPLSAELAAPCIASLRLPRRVSAGAAERERCPAGVGWVSLLLPVFPSPELAVALVNDVVSGVELEGVAEDVIAARGGEGMAMPAGQPYQGLWYG